MLLPPALRALQPLRDRVDAIVALLDRSGTAVVRADLATELVWEASRYEDVVTRVVAPALDEVGVAQDEVQLLSDRRDAVRSALVPIRQRTKHVHPINVHVSDPEGFEAELDQAVEMLAAQSAAEEPILRRAFDGLSGGRAEQLRRRLQRGIAHASGTPRPPSLGIARASST